MGRAYTDEEREQIRIRLLEAGLDIFHEDNSKAMNIREVAARAGISLGGFYSFYPDKESFVLDVMLYRERQKEDKARAFLCAPCSDPAGDLAMLLFDLFMDMRQKIITKKIYRDSVQLIMRATDEKREAQNKEIEKFVSDIAALWAAQGLDIHVDIQGVSSVIYSAGLLILHGRDISSAYFEDILRDMMLSGIRRYVKASEVLEDE